MQVNIKVDNVTFDYCCQACPKSSKTSLQYLRNDMLDYLDFWYVPRAPCDRKSFLDMAINEYHN